MTELLYLTDAYATEFDAVVTEVDAEGRRVAMDRTLFYPTGGGQPHDVGTLTVGGAALEVTGVRKEGATAWHTLGPGDLPAVGDAASGAVDWDRRHKLMRTHTAFHILCGVIWNEYGKAVTGGNMDVLKGRMDFEFDPLPDDFAATVTSAVNAEIAADRPIEVFELPRSEALKDEDLIRTKVNLIPDFVTDIRVVDIVGLDKQADGGTHVARTSEVGHFEITKTESKGKGNKRVRVVIT